LNSIEKGIEHNLSDNLGNLNIEEFIKNDKKRKFLSRNEEIKKKLKYKIWIQKWN